MANVIVPNWNKRKLSDGFVWQEFFICATQKITRKHFEHKYNGSAKLLVQARDKWENAVKSFIISRCEMLGMFPLKIIAYMQEEPDDEKPTEKVIWNSLDLAFVCSVWAYIEGPIRKEYHQPGKQLPIEGFWPNGVKMLNEAIAEILDAETMLKIEQSHG